MLIKADIFKNINLIEKNINLIKHSINKLISY